MQDKSHLLLQGNIINFYQANPRSATQKDDDERLPIHWALSNNHEAIVQLLVSRKDFDPDIQVRLSDVREDTVVTRKLTRLGQDGSGWTPLMIASSLKEGDDLVDLLLSKDADVNIKSAFSRCHYLNEALSSF